MLRRAARYVDARRFVVGFVVAVAVLGAIGLALYVRPVDPPNIALLWNGDVTAEERPSLERRYGLDRPRPLADDWLEYRLLDFSRANVAAILAEPRVASTKDLHRWFLRVTSLHRMPLEQGALRVLCLAVLTGLLAGAKRRVIVPGNLLRALAAVPPLAVMLTLVVGAVPVGGGVFYIDYQPTLAAAIYSRDYAAVAAMKTEDPFPRTRSPLPAGLFVESEVSLLPLEAAVLSADPWMLEWLVDLGAVWTPDDADRLHCLTVRYASDPPAMQRVLEAAGILSTSPDNCPDELF